jgi:hypothetical protein
MNPFNGSKRRMTYNLKKRATYPIPLITNAPAFARNYFGFNRSKTSCASNSYAAEPELYLS